MAWPCSAFSRVQRALHQAALLLPGKGLNLVGGDLLGRNQADSASAALRSLAGPSRVISSTSWTTFLCSSTETRNVQRQAFRVLALISLRSTR
jgi:hypothetical protein